MSVFFTILTGRTVVQVQYEQIFTHRLVVTSDRPATYSTDLQVSEMKQTIQHVKDDISHSASSFNLGAPKTCDVGTTNINCTKNILLDPGGPTEF